MMRVVFAGTPAFAAAALDALIREGAEVPLVLTQPDRPAGRGMRLQPSPVKQVAERHGISVMQPTGLRLDGRFGEEAQAAREALTTLQPDVMVVAAYGLILPSWALELPRLGCLNIHASLLPRWRGAAPIHRAIEAGDAETGVTIMQMDAGLDTGDMLLSRAVPIGPQDTTASLHDRLADLGSALLIETLDRARRGALTPAPQPAEGVTYAHKIEKTESVMDWSEPAVVLERRIRAFDPFPGMVTHHGAEPIKVWRAFVVHGVATGQPGQVLSVDRDGVAVSTGDGVLCLTELQRAGGRRMPVGAFLQAHALKPGDRLDTGKDAP